MRLFLDCDHSIGIGSFSESKKMSKNISGNISKDSNGNMKLFGLDVSLEILQSKVLPKVLDNNRVGEESRQKCGVLMFLLEECMSKRSNINYFEEATNPCLPTASEVKTEHEVEALCSDSSGNSSSAVEEKPSFIPSIRCHPNEASQTVPRISSLMFTILKVTSGSNPSNMDSTKWV